MWLCKAVQCSTANTKHLYNTKSLVQIVYNVLCLLGEGVDLVAPKHLHNICTMLDQRRRRWADAVQMLYK